MSKNWKTRWCSLLLVLSMLAGLCVPAYAVPEDRAEVPTSETEAEIPEMKAENKEEIAASLDAAQNAGFTGVDADSEQFENDLAPMSDEGIAPAAASLTGYPDPTAEWTDSFETTAAAPAGNVTTYWKNATIPTGWDQMWVANAPSSADKMYFEVTGDVQADGNSSIHIHSEDAGGRICVFPLAASALDYSKDYILRIRIKSENVTGTGVYFRVQVGSGYNKNVFSESRKVTGTTDWTAYEIEMKNIAAQAGDSSGNFKLEIFAEKMTGDAWVDAVEFIPLDASGGVADVIFNENCEETVTDNKWTGSVAPKNFYDLGFYNAIGGIQVSVDNTTAHSGQNSIHIANPADNTSGRIAVQCVLNDFDFTQDYVLRAWMKTQNINNGGSSWRGPMLRAQILDTTHAENRHRIESSVVPTGNTDWKLIEIKLDDLVERSTDKTSGATKASGRLQVQFECNAIKGDVWIDDIQIVPAGYRLEINTTSVKLVPQGVFQLEATGAPASHTVTWASSDERVATVDQTGKVTAVSGGTAEITASTDEDHVVSCTVQVSDAAVESTFASMRRKWVDRLTGNPYWKGDATIAAYKTTLVGWDETAAEIRGKLVKDDPAKLFSDLTLNIQSDLTNKGSSTTSSDSEPYFTAMDRIQGMAKVWSAEGSQYYHNESLKDDILYALDWMEEHAYNAQLNNQAMFGNWYHWWISLPQSLAGTVILMHDEMDADLLAREAAVLERFNEDPIYVYKVKGAAGRMDMTGANLADTSLASLLRGAACSDQMAAANGTKYFNQVVQVVTSGDGLYADGSFIQHTNLPYTGGYGSTLLNGAEKMLYLSTGTPWAVDADEVETVYAFIWNGVRPLYADGAMFDMVNGRGVARPSSADVKTGRGILWPIVLLTDSAPAEYQGKLKSFAKGQLIAGVKALGEEEYFNHSNVAAVIASQALVADNSVAADSNSGYAKVFGSMDRAVAHSKNFSLGISYSSSRTGRFEFGNEENKLGWHQSDGALYLYNGDPQQYADNYWNTVDPHRLAGITTDHSKWTINNWGNYVGNGTFNGGSVAGPYMSLAQDFKNYTTADNPNLAAHKSWFVFDNEVVALGAGITGVAAGRTTETIVENKKINGDNDFVVDGSAAVSALGDSADSEGAQWAWLAGNTSADSIGYFFPETADLKLLRESRTSSWSAVNGAAGVSTDPVTRNYLSIAIPHNGAEGDSYSYVLLPGMSQTETQAYAANSGLIVLSNTAQLQAVADSGANAAGFTFWQAGEVEMPEGGKITSIVSDGAASVTLYQSSGRIFVGISDPSQKGSSVKITLEGESLSLGTLEAGITGEKTETGVVLTVSVGGLRGNTLTAQLSDGTASGGGSSGGGSTSVTVPVSGDKNSVDVKASVSGSTATVEKIDTIHLDEVAGSDVDTGMVVIDFTGLNRKIDTVNLPTGTVREISQAASDSGNDTEGLTVRLSTGEVSFDTQALDAVQEQASGDQITLSVAAARTSDLNARQREAVGDNPVFDLTLKSGGKTITSFGDGYVTVSLPHTLQKGQNPNGVIVYYLDDAGNTHRCRTVYNVSTKMVTFTTDHLSLYVVGYENNPFTDITANDYFYEAVLWAVEKNIVSGTSATTFSPNLMCTRGQMVTLLWNAAGSPAPQGEGTSFTDIHPGAYYYDAVRWAAEKGVVKGTSATTFSPDLVCTRGQMAALLWYAEGSPAPQGGNIPFTDVQPGAYYYDAVRWAAEKDIVKGSSTTTFSPDLVCTRGQIITFLYRSMK